MTIKNFSPYSVVGGALADLKEKERKVIAARFGIDLGRQTLSAIGKELKLSRERVRQIEKEGLRKLANEILEKNKENIDRIVESISEVGGIVVGHKIADRFLEEAYRGNKNQFNSLNLILFIMPQLKKLKKTKELEESWILASLSRAEAIKVINEWVEHLKKVNKPQTIDVLLNVHPHHSKYEITFLSELPAISKRIIKTEDGHVGLASWSLINPRNIRDKVYYILKKAAKPLHFEDISQKIEAQQFDSKKVVKATVHNELIADKRFVLVGRGVYALREWGYKPGTVADVIKEVLQDKKNGLETEEIIEEVLKNRVVKKNTILINLKTKPVFKRIGEDRFCLA